MILLYCICFLVMGTALPVLAKNDGINDPVPFASSKAGSKASPMSCANPASATALAKDQIHEKSEVVITPDTSRATVSAALLAKQESAPPPATTAAHKEVTAPSSSPAEETKNATFMAFSSTPSPLRTASGPVTTDSDSLSELSHAVKRLARVTAYWAAEGDYYTERCISATGVRLHDGHCAVDPNIIPYGSVVEIAGIGKFLAVDTGSAVIERTAAREGGHTSAERNALVVDLFFENRSEGERFAAGTAKYVSITWWTPSSVGVEAKAARSLFADENWTKIESKQL